MAWFYVSFRIYPYASEQQNQFLHVAISSGIQTLTNVHHTFCGSLCVAAVLRKGKNACMFPGYDIGYTVLQKKQFDCCFTTGREE